MTEAQVIERRATNPPTLRFVCTAARRVRGGGRRASRATIACRHPGLGHRCGSDLRVVFHEFDEAVDVTGERGYVDPAAGEIGLRVVG